MPPGRPGPRSGPPAGLPSRPAPARSPTPRSSRPRLAAAPGAGRRPAGRPARAHAAPPTGRASVPGAGRRPGAGLAPGRGRRGRGPPGHRGDLRVVPQRPGGRSGQPARRRPGRPADRRRPASWPPWRAGSTHWSRPSWTETDLAETVAVATPSVFRVTTPFGDGSAWVARSEGGRSELVTNYHVLHSRLRGGRPGRQDRPERPDASRARSWRWPRRRTSPWSRWRPRCPSCPWRPPGPGGRRCAGARLPVGLRPVRHGRRDLGLPQRPHPVRRQHQPGEQRRAGARPRGEVIASPSRRSLEAAPRARPEPFLKKPTQSSLTVA